MHKKLCRWISIGDGKWAAVKMNWVTFLLATILTWGFAIWSASDPSAGGYFGTGKSWVSQNFTWLYLGTQDVWCAFLVYLCFSRFGNIRLGKDNERPKYNDFSWFCMLFTCGVAVGLYVFGVSEPLYFYRQPTLWHSWAYDYTITKTTIGNDAQRAQQAIFQTVYHWGIHGWVPYILLAINIGIVCYRYNMPMTIRSCFVPLIGDNALGVIGDMIDALSIATTTFGVCTSLALGVGQIAYGMQQITDFSCDLKANCASAGGTWDIQTYGANSCIGATSEVPTCHVLYPTADDEMSAKYLIIVIITCLATLSVISGLDNGIVILAKAAFTFGTVVMMTIMFNDNTWYLLNVMVQTFGYYLQYIVQVGFDCEAFQQLGFEFQGEGGANHYWGSGYETLQGKLADIAEEQSGLRDQVTHRELTMVWQFMPHAAEVRSAQAAMLKSAKAPVVPKIPAYTATGLRVKKHGKEVQPIFLSARDELSDADVKRHIGKLTGTISSVTDGRGCDEAAGEMGDRKSVV